uniref:Putative site-specific DNA endonuclease n=1 Tax=Trebouxia aggregata TaxID=160068 RepID=G8XP85_9CHLO|nr:putative site-specific DNA endonuclease [Trebouxia aggregata]
MEVSIPKPKTRKPDPLVPFGFFLAGLIDSDGHFSKIPQLVVEFHEKEIHTPYYLKKKIGYGIVSRVKNKKAVNFIMAHSLGLEKVCALVHNKLRHKDKIIQYNTRLRSLKNFTFTEKQLVFSIKENSWFSGFFMGDGCFQIKIIKRIQRKMPECRVVIQIDQKTDTLLLQIKNAFGGSVYFRKSQNTYYYSSVNFASAKRVIQYFDQFHLMGIKMTQYTLWRKVLLKIQIQNFNRTELDYRWITNVKKRMSCLSYS